MKWLCACFSMLLMTQSFASMRSAINSDVHHLTKHVNIGIKVVTLQGKTLYAYHSQQQLVPASNMKLYTAEAALNQLGAQYQFKTRLYAVNTRVVRGTLTGNVYLDYSGDPSLTIQDINQLFQALNKLGVRQIKGDFVYDRYAFDQNDIAPGWNRRDLQYCFSAPINAAMINRNCIAYRVSPGRRHGHRLRVRAATPALSFVQFDNQGTTGLTRRLCAPLAAHIQANNVIAIKGCMLVNSRPIGLSNAVQTAKGFNVAVIQSLLQKNDIRLSGHIVSGHVYSGLHLLSTHASASLYQLIHRLLKRSDNIIASTLYKKLGQQYSHQPGSWSNGSSAVKAILSKTDHVNLQDSVIIGGSGLSHFNRSNADEFTQLLIAAYHQPNFHYLMSALPIGGIDGTLKYRLKSRYTRGRVFAKTGTLSGVASLSGYVKTRTQGTLVFSILINGFSGSPAPYRSWIDRIVTTLARS